MLTNFDRYISKAQKLIYKPQCRYKHFTFITNGNYIASIGVNNKYKTHPIANKYGHRFFSVHSEINAISKFPYNIQYLRKFSLINIRLNKKGELRLSKPCLSCAKLICELKITNVFFSNNYGTFEKF